MASRGELEAGTAGFQESVTECRREPVLAMEVEAETPVQEVPSGIGGAALSPAATEACLARVLNITPRPRSRAATSTETANFIGIFVLFMECFLRAELRGLRGP